MLTTWRITSRVKKPDVTTMARPAASRTDVVR
jgi:hypothetical protein